MRTFSKTHKSVLSLLFFSFLMFSTLHVVAKLNIINQTGNIIEFLSEKDETDVPIIKYSKETSQGKKDWTLMLYIAADNDLRNFAIRNIKQLAQIGSNNHINIIVHLDIKLSGNNKVTKRYYIKNNQILHLNAEDPKTQRMDSGNPETLISFCEWGIQNFPANNYGLLLWNHGTGALDPRRGRIVKLSDLFKFNPLINKIEIDRSIGFFDLLNATQFEDRGICWDDTTGNYLTGQDLDYALKTISTKLLKGEKISFIGFDACLMQMIEVASIVKKYANVMIGSQEVILGTGWNYLEVLKPFQNKSLNVNEFSKHIIDSYQKTYQRITNDYTLSAINLEWITPLEENINKVSILLTECLKKQTNQSVKKSISTSRSKMLCTHFDEPSYIDIHHFYLNLLSTLSHFTLSNTQEEIAYKKELKQALLEGCEIIERSTIANVVGKNLSKAKGMSIYFPTNRIYFSYRNLTFCQNNNWIVFLTQYLNV